MDKAELNKKDIMQTYDIYYINNLNTTKGEQQRSAPYQTASMNQWAQPCVETKQQYRTLEIVISPPLLLLLFAVSLMPLKISPQNGEPKT
jgi:hypothetical protein